MMPIIFLTFSAEASKGPRGEKGRRAKCLNWILLASIILRFNDKKKNTKNTSENFDEHNFAEFSLILYLTVNPDSFRLAFYQSLDDFFYLFFLPPMCLHRPVFNCSLRMCLLLFALLSMCLTRYQQKRIKWRSKCIEIYGYRKVELPQCVREKLCRRLSMERNISQEFRSSARVPCCISFELTLELKLINFVRAVKAAKGSIIVDPKHMNDIFSSNILQYIIHYTV